MPLDQTIYQPAEPTDHGSSTTPQDTYVYTGESYVWCLIPGVFSVWFWLKNVNDDDDEQAKWKNVKEVMDNTTAAAAAAERWTTTITAAAAEQTSHQ